MHKYVMLPNRSGFEVCPIILQNLLIFSGEDNTVMVHIRKLREKIEDNPGQPRLWLLFFYFFYYY